MLPSSARSDLEKSGQAAHSQTTEGLKLTYGSKIGQKEVLLSIHHDKTARALQERHIGYEAASAHSSETDSLPPTKNLNGMASSPSSVPPIVRRANLMRGT